ncbi:MAG: hypothetical protein ACLRFR_00225 [Clostridia bacterium]
MENIYNQIRTFIVFELDPIVRILLVGLFAIFGIFCIINVVKAYVNAKSYSSPKIAPIIFAIIFLGIATFIAVV